MTQPFVEQDASSELGSTPLVPGWGWGAIIASASIMLLITGLAVGVLFGLTRWEIVERGHWGIELGLLGLGFLAYGTLVVGVYLFAARRFGWDAVGVRHTEARYYGWVLPAYFVGTTLAALTSLLLQAILGAFENPQVGALRGEGGLSLWEFAIVFVLVAVVAPVAEELFFRGMIFPVMRRRLGATSTIILNAALFSVIHLIPLLIPALFVVGVMLAYLREKSGSVGPSVLYHMLQNGIALWAMRELLLT